MNCRSFGLVMFFTSICLGSGAASGAVTERSWTFFDRLVQSYNQGGIMADPEIIGAYESWKGVCATSDEPNVVQDAVFATAETGLGVTGLYFWNSSPGSALYNVRQLVGWSPESFEPFRVRNGELVTRHEEIHYGSWFLPAATIRAKLAIDFNYQTLNMIRFGSDGLIVACEFHK